MLAGMTPPQINALAVYTNGCLLNWGKTAALLGLEYSAGTKMAARYPPVAEVKLGKAQHFVVVDADGTQYDPWTGKVAKNIYPILGYRNISPRVPATAPIAQVDKGELVVALGKFV